MNQADVVRRPGAQLEVRKVELAAAEGRLAAVLGLGEPPEEVTFRGVRDGGIVRRRAGRLAG